MKPLDERHKFISLRALGYSIISASKLTGIARSTGTIWNQDYQNEIHLLKTQEDEIFLEECAKIRRKCLQYYKLLFEKLSIDFLNNGLPNLTPSQKFNCLMKIIDCLEKLNSEIIKSAVKDSSDDDYEEDEEDDYEDEDDEEDEDDDEDSDDDDNEDEEEEEDDEITEEDLLDMPEITKTLPEQTELIEEGNTYEELEAARKYEEFINKISKNQDEYRDELKKGMRCNEMKSGLIYPDYMQCPPKPPENFQSKPKAFIWKSPGKI